MPGKVLLADDSLNIQKTVTQLLQEADIEVVTVGNGEYAVRKLADVKPDLVLADLFMPVRNGFEVCEYIKNSEEFAHVPVLVLASSMEPYDEKEAQRVGVDARLTKPFSDPAAALATIKQWLEKATQAKPPEPAPPIEEFAAAVPAAEAEEQPEPIEEFTTGPPPVTFDQQEAPMGFTDVLEEAPAAPPETPPPETPAPATGFVTAEPVEEPLAPPEPTGVEPSEVEAPPAPMEEPTAAAPPPAEAPPEPTPPPLEEAPPKPEYQIEKPELASPWEMTGPPPGAPEIPAGDEWDSQWKGPSEAEAPEASGLPTEATEPAPPEADQPAAAEPLAAERFEAAEFAAAMAAAGQTTPPQPAEAPAVDPALVEAVVKEVLARLSPQVVEQITREIVHPLAEALLKQKLNQQ